MQAEDNEDDRLRRHECFDQIPIASPINPSMSTASAGSQHVVAMEPPKPNPKILLVLLKGIIMALIISLFFLLLGIAAVALLHFVIAGGAHHCRRLRRSSSSRVRLDSAIAAYSAEELLRFLPSYEYSHADMAATDCAICLECFKVGEWVRSLPDCNHTFHSNCVGQWLTRVANCPICRSRVRLNLGASGSEVGDEDYRIFWGVVV